MRYIFLLISCLGSLLAFAQSELPEDFGDYRSIPNPEPGKVYIQAYVPPTFKKVVWRDSILLLENNPHLIENLEEGKDYDILTEIVEIRPAYTVWEFEEPILDTIIEEKTLIVDRICEEIEPMPKFENQVIIERQKILDWSFKFIPYPLTKNLRLDCISYKLANNKNAYIVSYAMIEIPARYVSVQKKVFQKDGKWWTETIADTFYAKRERLFTMNINHNIQDYPAVIDTFRRIILFDDALDKVEKLSFSTIYTKIIDEQDYFVTWQEMICAKSCPKTFVIQKIQKALIKKGYKVPTDNIFGKETKAALLQFQKDNNLPQGHLDKKTLKALGFE